MMRTNTASRSVPRQDALPDGQPRFANVEERRDEEGCGDEDVERPERPALRLAEVEIIEVVAEQAHCHVNTEDCLPSVSSSELVNNWATPFLGPRLCLGPHCLRGSASRCGSDRGPRLRRFGRQSLPGQCGPRQSLGPRKFTPSSGPFRTVNHRARNPFHYQHDAAARSASSFHSSRPIRLLRAPMLQPLRSPAAPELAARRAALGQLGVIEPPAHSTHVCQRLPRQSSGGIDASGRIS